MPKVSLKNENTSIIIKNRQLLLDGLLQQGIEHPYSCRAGQCGLCKCKLISGSTKRELCDPQALSDIEQQAGYFLACRTRALSDLIIDRETVKLERNKSVKGKIIHAEPLNKSVVRIFVQPEEEFSFYAGQYVHLKIENLPMRPYSMANIPENPLLEFHIKRIDGGIVSRYIYDKLPINEEVDISGPFGLSCITQQPSKPVLLVASGTGLAPIVSIARQLLKNNFTHPINLYFSVVNTWNYYYLNELNNMAERCSNLQLHLIQATPSSSIRHGNLWDIISADIKSPKTLLSYLAGSPRLIRQVQSVLLAKGLPSTSIHCDEFTEQPTRCVKEMPLCFSEHAT